MMLADLRADEFGEVCLDAFVCAFLVGTHQARIAHHIGGEDRDETTGGGGRGHGSSGANSRAEFNLFPAETCEFHTAERPVPMMALTRTDASEGQAFGIDG